MESPLSDLILMNRSITDYHIESGSGFGCILGNMALESAGHNPSLSLFTRSVFEGCGYNITRLLNASAESGEIKPVKTAELYARAVISQIEGALMLSRVYADFSHFKSITDLLISELMERSLWNVKQGRD